MIPRLKEKGLRLAVIKHDAHGIEIDKEGKDSWRFTEAGSDMTLVSSPEKSAIIENRPMELKELFRMIHDVDLVLVEGYKNEPLSQIGIARKENGKGFTSSLDRFEAIVTDLEGEDLIRAIVDARKVAESAGHKVIERNVGMFGFEDKDELTDFIVENMNLFRTVTIG